MDKFEAGKIFKFDNFTFKASKYEEYQSGQLISRGNTDIQVFCETENDVIKTHLLQNNIYNKINSEFEFDICITLNDRLLMVISPKQTNVEDMTMIYLKHMVGYTRHEKYYSSLEPIVCSIFTENMNIVKITFKTCNPERLIELY